jgi:hypothetical protein
MPRGDRTGPLGEGPTTGRGMGNCTDNDHPANMNTFWNRGGGYGRRFHGGQGYGRGGGFGFRGGYGSYTPGNISDVSEKTLIENDIRILKDQLSALEDRLTNIGEK